jgi:peptidoglycan/xylan/chitin deacetylase (PgdA/CDA1 family)
LATLARDPLVTIGAHSVTHPVLSDLDDRSALEEMACSKSRLCETLRVPIDHFAYPFGGITACGDREHALARAVGFKTATTTEVCNIFPNDAHRLWSLPRVSLDSSAERLSALDCHWGVTALFRKRLRHPAICNRLT